MSAKLYKIEIQEILSRLVEIEANDKEEAISKIKKMYHDEKIILDSSDYITTEIFEFKYSTNEPKK
ncbi:DpnD protein [Flavobacteriaceae bacterium Ap0902]|nr:DpnD protein [Flavobacteriaceae bacterium Ap0902]